MKINCDDSAYMFEAELKALVKDERKLLDALRDLGACAEAEAIYDDRYFDKASGELRASQRELRIRRVFKNQTEECLLTAKLAPFDAATRSKQEFEISLREPDIAEDILKTIGFNLDIALRKECRNFRFSFNNRNILATLAHIRELGKTFIELESLVPDQNETPNALNTLEHVLDKLCIPREDLTSEYYTDAVRASRFKVKS